MQFEELYLLATNIYLINLYSILLNIVRMLRLLVEIIFLASLFRTVLDPVYAIFGKEVCLVELLE